MKKSFKIVLILLLGTLPFICGGCFLFEFPYEFDNPLDPKFESEGSLELVSENARRLYESRNGISYTSSMDITPDGAYILIGDEYKPEIMVYNVAASSETYINFGEDALPVVDIAALGGEAYVATSEAVYRVDLGSNAFEQAGGYTDFEILYYDIDMQDAVGYMITRQEAEDSGEVYHLRWYDQDGNELGSVEGDWFRNINGFAVSADYVYLSSRDNHCINVLSQSDHTLVSQIFFNGSAIEQAATTVYNSYDSAYSYYDLNWDWDDTLPEMGAVISDLPSNEVAAAFQHPDTTTVNLVWGASITQMDNFSDWSSIKAGIDPITGDGYAADAVFRTITLMDTVSGTVVFTSPAAENDELLRVSDMDLRGDGTYFLVDEQKWSVNAFHSGGGTWSSLGTTGSYTPGTDILSYPQAAGANGERSYIAMHGGGAVLQVFDSAGAHITDIDVGSAGYGNITDIELYDSGNFTVWDDDSKQIGYFEVGKPDERRAPFDTESVQFCDLERYGERTYAAVSYSGESVIGYFSGTDFSEGNFTVLWSSGSEALFNMDLGYHQPFAVSHVDVTENGIWTVFPAIASAVKFTQSGELIGSVCLDEGFGGQRVLPGRLYDFRSAAEDGDGGVAVGGFSASEAVEDGVSVDYITVFDNDSARLRSYRIIFPADE